MMTSWLAELDELDPEPNLSWVTSEQLGAGWWSCVSRGGASSGVCSVPAGPAGGALQDHSAGPPQVLWAEPQQLAPPPRMKRLAPMLAWQQPGHHGGCSSFLPGSCWIWVSRDQEVEPSARLTCAARLEH